MAQQEAAIPIKATALSSLKRLLKSNCVILKMTSAEAINTNMLVKIFMTFILACNSRNRLKTRSFICLVELKITVTS